MLMQNQTESKERLLQEKDPIDRRITAPNPVPSSAEATRPDRFIQAVAHQMKNSLSSIRGFAELLLNGHSKMSDEEREYHLSQILISSFTMQNTIEEILLLTRANSQKEISVTLLNMAQIISNVRDRLAFMIREHRAKLIVPNGKAWPAAYGYAPWVEEVWINYISNAIKYGGNTTTPPLIELGGTVENGAMVRFWVRDNGPGIAPEDQQQLFEPFTRLVPTNIEGHGLGLFVARQIIERLGGQVKLESTPGYGSVFSFTLPHVSELSNKHNGKNMSHSPQQ